MPFHTAFLDYFHSDRTIDSRNERLSATVTIDPGCGVKSHAAYIEDRGLLSFALYRINLKI